MTNYPDDEDTDVQTPKAIRAAGEAAGRRTMEEADRLLARTQYARTASQVDSRDLVIAELRAVLEELLNTVVHQVGGGVDVELHGRVTAALARSA